MRKSLAVFLLRNVVMLGFAAALVPAAVAWGDNRDTREAQAELAPFNMPPALDTPSQAQGEIEFVDTGTTLQFRGQASGLDPTRAYISLIYDNGSVPTGRDACEPSRTGRPQLTGAQMFLGRWTVNEEGEGTLSGENSGAAYTPVGTFRSVSIRVVLRPGPGGSPRVACGLVVDNE